MKSIAQVVATSKCKLAIQLRLKHDFAAHDFAEDFPSPRSLGEEGRIIEGKIMEVLFNANA